MLRETVQRLAEGANAQLHAEQTHDAAMAALTVKCSRLQQAFHTLSKVAVEQLDALHAAAGDASKASDIASALGFDLALAGTSRGRVHPGASRHPTGLPAGRRYHQSIIIRPRCSSWQPRLSLRLLPNRTRSRNK